MAFSGGMGADLTKKQEDNFNEEDAYVPLQDKNCRHSQPLDKEC